MTYPFGSPDFYGSGRNGPARFRSGPFSSRVLLVAINGDLMPPILHDNVPLHRMRVTLVPPNEVSEWDSSEPLPPTVRRTLPPLVRAPASPPPAPMRTRLVRGEILRDHEGRLYEKIADKIRPIHKLFSGPRGEILELVPRDAPDWEEQDQEIDVQARADGSGSFATAIPKGQAEDTQPPPRNENPIQNQHLEADSAKPKLTAYRQLFAEPGPKRVVRLGDFKAMLTPQLVHPERLRDTHRLGCHLQVYEVTRASPLEALATSALGDAGLVNQLDILTEPVVRALSLDGLPRNRLRIPPNFRRQPGVVLPNERVFRLCLAYDPTAEDEQHPVGPANPQAQATWTPEHSQNPGRFPSGALKKSIPERFAKAWEFKLSREEALYDMNVNATFTGWLALLAGRLARWIGIRRELKKWKVMLCGKTPDEQLWVVRPPKGGVAHRAIREWARKTLEAGGYETPAMLQEWEIFWRRKGA